MVIVRCSLCVVGSLYKVTYLGVELELLNGQMRGGERERGLEAERRHLQHAQRMAGSELRVQSGSGGACNVLCADRHLTALEHAVLLEALGTPRRILIEGDEGRAAGDAGDVDGGQPACEAAAAADAAAATV